MYQPQALKQPLQYSLSAQATEGTPWPCLPELGQQLEQVQIQSIVGSWIPRRDFRWHGTPKVETHSIRLELMGYDFS